MKYISEMVGLDYTEWNTPSKVLLFAQTGSGKTTFDECHYFTDDSSFNQKTEFWSNILNPSRLMDKNQIHVFLTATPEEIIHLIYKNPFSFELLNRSSESIEISFRRNFYDSEKPLEFDSYDGATLNRIYEYFIGTDEKRGVKYHPFLPEKTHNWGLRSFKWYIYPTVEDDCLPPNDYSYISPYYYEDLDSFSDEICFRCKENKTAKWLIFVESKQKGFELNDKLRNHDICSVFITAISSSNNQQCNNELKRITENQQFDAQVLISTSVLFNGVSIKDENVSDIVIPYTEKVQFIQALGRIRISPNRRRTVRLYMPQLSYGYVYKKMEFYRKRSMLLIRFHNLQASTAVKYREEYLKIGNYNVVSAYRTKMERKVYKSLPTKYLAYISRDENDRVKSFNELALNKPAALHVFYLYSEYREMLCFYQSQKAHESNLHAANPFFQFRLSWLGISVEKPYQEYDAVYERNIKRFNELCHVYLDCEISKDEQDRFRKDIYDVLSLLSPDTFLKDRSRYEGGKMLPGKDRLNQALERFNYKIESIYKKRTTYWVLKVKKADE